MSIRKAQSTPHGEKSPNKRATRANIAPIEAEPVFAVKNQSTSPRKRGRPPGSPVTESPSKKTRPTPRRQPTQSVILSTYNATHNPEGETRDVSDSDELLLLPQDNLALDLPTTPRKSKRLVMDSIVIVTPSKSSASVRTRRSVSPSPTKTRKPNRTEAPKRSQPITPRTSESILAVSPGKGASSHRNPMLATPKKHSSSTHLPHTLPSYLHACLAAQKRAILAALHCPTFINFSEHPNEECEASTNDIALQQLTALLTGTVGRGEGNSCLVMGPRGSGKTRIFEKALASLSAQPITIRLSGYVQHNDRLAMREIARQISIQTDSQSSLLPPSLDDDDNPFVDHHRTESYDNAELDGAVTGILPSSSHLPSLISALPMLSRPVVILLDAFDQFTSHARQALLYCLLDTVQSCRSGIEGTKGLAVIGMTARVDVVNLLEKRVKSRFSHRILRTAGMRKSEEWETVLRNCLCSEIDDYREERRDNINHGVHAEHGAMFSEWEELWHRGVDQFLHERDLKDILRDTFGITRDFRVLARIMTGAVLDLTPNSPFLSTSKLQSHVTFQRNPSRFQALFSLSYPSVSLLIAAQHVRTSGHDLFTFEMLHESFRNQVRTSAAAPVTVEGGGIGMMNVGRGILMGAFEHLVMIRIFRPLVAPAAGIIPEFVKYRCVADRAEVKAAVERNGQTNLKKWLSKAQ